MQRVRRNIEGEVIVKVIRKRPGEAPELIDIPNALEALQKEVGGYIETYTFAKNACIVCNEEGRLLDLPCCSTTLGVEFAGPILVVGVDGEEFCDVPMPFVTAWFLLREILEV